METCSWVRPGKGVAILSEQNVNLGRKQPSYSLDWISDFHLKRKKLEYKKEGQTLDSFYLDDPVNFLLYNIIDVTLCDGLNKTLKHIENHNMFRRLMKTSLDASVRGASILFDTFVLYKLNKDNKFIRFGINEETSFEIPNHEIKQLPTPTSKKKINWNIKSIDANVVSRISGTYPGAYVKDSPGKLYTSEDGLIIGLDAKSLYPSMILQQNISFDSFFGVIIDPNAYKILEFIRNNLGNVNIINQVCGNLLEFAVDYVEKTEPANKNDAYQYNYYIAAYTVAKLLKECKNFDNLLKPTSYQDYIMLKKYLLTLISMMEKIHKNASEYNTFCYDRFINETQSFKNKDLYIIENFYNPNIRITKVNESNLDDYLRQNKLILTLSGGLFYQHSEKMGLFSDWLEMMGDLRKQYRKQRDYFQVEKGHSCDEAKFYDMTQNAVKVAMNTSYGLYGLNSFRYSNHYLASAITTQGRYMLKICQQISDMYIDYYSKNK